MSRNIWLVSLPGRPALEEKGVVMYAWLNLVSKRRHLADNFEMTTYCGRPMALHYEAFRSPPRRWKSLGRVELQSLGSQRLVAPDLCLTCAALAQPWYFESETGQKLGKPIPREWVEQRATA